MTMVGTCTFGGSSFRYGMHAAIHCSRTSTSSPPPPPPPPLLKLDFVFTTPRFRPLFFPSSVKVLLLVVVTSCIILPMHFQRKSQRTVIYISRASRWSHHHCPSSRSSLLPRAQTSALLLFSLCSLSTQTPTLAHALDIKFPLLLPTTTAQLP
ncbi:hypothetical protein HDV57DRAFT_116322 [Trichoderma longibrachiatum]